MSKGTIGTFVGAGIGFFLTGGNPLGAQIGAALGGAIGSSMDTIPGRRVGEMSSPRAEEGSPIPLVFGSARVTGRLMSVGEPDIRTEKEGGKGGPKVENETAYLSYSILICESSELRDSTIGGILMVYQNNKIVYDMRPDPAISAADSAKWAQNKRFYFGGESQGVDPTEQMIHGIGNVPAYRGLCRMVVEDEDVTQHGGSIPNYEFVTSQCGVEVLPAAEEWRWLGTGQTGAGTRASIRPMSSALAWMGAADSEVIPTNTTSSKGVARYGDKMFAILNSGTCRVADVSNVTTWSAGPTGLSLGTAPLGHTSVFGGKLWVACGNLGVSHLSTTADAAFVADSSMLTLFGTATYRQVLGVTGSGTKVLLMNGFGRFVLSGNSGASWAAGADILGTGNRFYTSLGAIDSNGDRIVAAGGETGLRAAYSDNNGATFTNCSLPASAGEIANQVKYVGNSRWLIACDDATTASDGLYKSTDNGTTFSAVTLPHAVEFTLQSKQNIAVDSTTGRVVIAGVQVGTGTPRYYYSDDLNAWTEISRTGTAVTGIVDVYPYGETGGGWYSPPDGGTELPDVPGHYYDPSTGGTSGPTVVVDTCPPITLSEIIDKLDARAGIPSANTVTTALDGITVPGYAIDTFATVAEAKEPLRRVYFFDCPEYDDAIRYRLRGGATDFTVDPDDLIVGEDATEKGVRGQTVEFPKRFHFQYVDPVTGYKPMKQTAERVSPDVRSKGEEVASANITLDADTAKRAAEIGLKTAWTAREDSREIVVPMDYLRAIPSDCYSLNGRRYRITELRIEAGAIYIQSEYDRISAYSSNAAGAVGPSPGGTSTLSGPTVSALMNLPVLRDADDKAGIYWAASGVLESWPGAQLQLARDGVTFEVGPKVTQSATMGTLSADLASASRYGMDSTNTLSVTLTTTSGALDSTDDEGLLEGKNAAAIIYPDNTVEIIQFKTPTETASKTYNITGLLRGRKDTVAGAHASGAQFVLLDETVRFVGLRADDRGKTLTFRPVSLNTPAGSNPTQTITLTTLESLREWSPYNVQVESDGSGGYCVEWIGRARLGTSRTPVHSQWFEGYRVTFSALGAEYIVDTTAQSVCVAAAEFAAFTASPHVTVRARSRVATNDDDFDSPPAESPEYPDGEGAPNTGDPVTDPDHSGTWQEQGTPPDGYVGEPYYLIADGRDDYVFKGSTTAPLTIGGFTANVGAANVVSTASGSNGLRIRGIPLTAHTANAVARYVSDLADLEPHAGNVTDPITYFIKPTYSLPNWMARGEGWGVGLVDTTPPWTTMQTWGQGGSLESRAEFTTGTVRAEFTVSDMTDPRLTLIGLVTSDPATPDSAGTAYGGSWSWQVPANGTYAVEIDATTGAIEILNGAGTTVATHTLTRGSGKVYRFRFGSMESGVTIKSNFGNEAWVITPSGGYTGLPNMATIVPVQWYGPSNENFQLSSDGAYGPVSQCSGILTASGVGLLLGSFGHSTGQHRVRFHDASRTDKQRVGLCTAGQTGQLGSTGTSIGYRNSNTDDRFHMLYSTTGTSADYAPLQAGFDTNQAGDLHSRPTDVVFAYDATAAEIEVWIAEADQHNVIKPLRYWCTFTGVTAGTYTPALYAEFQGQAALYYNADEPSGFTDWTLTL